MVDSRTKGQRAEYAVRDLLRDKTKLGWERVPGSGGFTVNHGLKGDIYLPQTTGKISAFAIEVKHYADDVINSNLFNSTESQLEKFWNQTVREAKEISAKPMLIFKKDRGKWLCALSENELENISAKPTLIFTKGSSRIIIYLFEEVLAQGTEYFIK
jgi:hypothetical protein